MTNQSRSKQLNKPHINNYDLRERAVEFFFFFIFNLVWGEILPQKKFDKRNCTQLWLDAVHTHTRIQQQQHEIEFIIVFFCNDFFCFLYLLVKTETREKYQT